jgi:hypothetical protein
MLDARRNLICTSAHIGKSLVPVAYRNVEPRCYFCRKRADGCALYIAFLEYAGCPICRDRFATKPGLISWSHAQNMDSARDHSAVPSTGCSKSGSGPENPRVGGSIPPLATRQASTDLYTRPQKPCFIGFYCIPLSADVPSNHSQLPVCGGCFTWMIEHRK